MTPAVALVVDDEPAILHLLCRLIRSAGFDPLTAPDGRTALELVSRTLPGPPALVVTDIRMPGLDGITMVHALRARWPGVPVVFVSADPLGSDEIGRLGELVTKPFAVDVLGAAVRRAILRAALDRALAATGAAMGNVQVFDPTRAALTIEVHRGFREPFLRFFRYVADAHSACGAALRDRCGVVVEDVERSPIFRDTPALGVMLDAPARAVQSTPLVGPGGRVLGMLSTHYPGPHRFGRRELGAIGRIAARAARLLQPLEP